MLRKIISYLAELWAESNLELQQIKLRKQRQYLDRMSTDELKRIHKRRRYR